MHGTRVPFSAYIRQIPLIVVAFCSNGLSFRLTWRACAAFAPGHALLETLLMGLVWELAKLIFGREGTKRIFSQGWNNRLTGCGLLMVALVLQAGSIVASKGFFRHTNDGLVQQALANSVAYARDANDLTALDEQIASKIKSAAEDRTKAYKSRARATDQEVDDLRVRRDRVAERMSVAEASAYGLLSVDQPSGGFSESIRATAHWVMAIMLDLICMVSWSLLVTRLLASSADGEGSPTAQGRRPTLELIPTKQANRGEAPGASHAMRHQCHQAVSYRNSACDAPPASWDGGAPSRARHDTGFPSVYRMQCSGRDAERLQALYMQCKMLVATGQVKPRYKALQEALRVSQQVVGRFLASMVEEGILQLAKRRYVLVDAPPAAAVGGAA